MIHRRHRQTDRRTEDTRSQDHALHYDASCGKNVIFFLHLCDFTVRTCRRSAGTSQRPVQYLISIHCWWRLDATSPSPHTVRYTPVLVLLFTSPPRGLQSVTMSMSVCLFVRLHKGPISKTAWPNFAKIKCSVHVVCGRGSFLV